jgi:hypothetical protein
MLTAKKFVARLNVLCRTIGHVTSVMYANIIIVLFLEHKLHVCTRTFLTVVENSCIIFR